MSDETADKPPTPRKRLKAKVPPQGDPSATPESSSAGAEKVRKKRTIRNFPASTVEEAIEFATKIFEVGSGQPVRRFTLFDAMNKSPDSSASRQLIINSSKYGLTKGGYQAEQIELTNIGRKCVDDELSKREVAKARIETGIYSVEPFKALYEEISGSRLAQKAVLIDKIKLGDIILDVPNRIR